VKKLIPLIVLVGCSSGGGGAPLSYDAGRPRPRVIEPPSGVVRPVPPHAIDPGGVGPYRLGATQAEIFEALHSIPRVAILDVERVVDASVVRTEDDTVLVGGTPGERISFIAVLAPNIARTEKGVGVGSMRDDLAALGPDKVDPRVERDPRIVVPSSLPGAQFIVDGERVAAILLRKPEALGGKPRCAATAPAPDADIRAAVGLEDARIAAACLTSAGHEAVVSAGTTIAVVDGDGTRARRITSTDIPGLVWAAPLRSSEDRDEIVAITERRERDRLTESLIVLRLEGGRLVRSLEEKVHELTTVNAQWIGAQLDDVRLFLSVQARSDGYEVGGILVHGGVAGIRDVAPLVPRTVPRRRRGPSGAGVTPDAGLRESSPPDSGQN